MRQLELLHNEWLILQFNVSELERTKLGLEPEQQLLPEERCDFYLAYNVSCDTL